MRARPNIRAGLLATAVLGLLAVTPACGSRPTVWGTQPTISTSLALNNGVALVDDADHRVVLVGSLGASKGFALATPQSFPIGHHVASAQVSPDGFHLFVLSTGDWPPQGANDAPSLTVIDTSQWTPTSRPAAQTYTMSQPFPNLAVDPQGPSPSYAVAYQGSAAQSVFVENPNELVIFDLTKPPGDPSGSSPNPVVHTIQSFGSSPQALTFTPPLLVNPTADARRLLVIETKIDVTLLDLDHAFAQPPRPEVTVPLTTGTTAATLTPAGVAIDSFDPTSAADARIAVRTTSDTNVYTIAFGPPDPGDVNDFKPTVNLTDVGGVPSDMAFVHTDAGLRLAALVPSRSAAVLVEPDTSLTTNVALPSSYSNLSLVTGQVTTTAAPGVDVALLWNGSGPQSGAALWTLGKTVGQPYFSVQALDVPQPVQAVDDIPNSNRKVLESNGDQFFVLDLQSAMVAPLDAASHATLSIAPDGQRIWAFAKGGEDLASIRLDNLDPVPVLTETPIDAAYDVACLGDPSSRALFAIDTLGSGGATVFDAEDPQHQSRRVSALLLEVNP